MVSLMKKKLVDMLRGLDYMLFCDPEKWGEAYLDEANSVKEAVLQSREALMHLGIALDDLDAALREEPTERRVRLGLLPNEGEGS